MLLKAYDPDSTMHRALYGRSHACTQTYNAKYLTKQAMAEQGHTRSLSSELDLM